MIKHYLYERKGIMLIIALACICYWGVLFFEKVEIDVIYYSTLIYLLMTFLLGLIDFYRYQNKIKKIKWLSEHLNTENFDLQSDDYAMKTLIKVISQLQNQQSENLQTYDNKKKDMVDFYAMWIHQVKTPIFALKLLSTQSEILSEVIKIEHYIEMVLNYIKLQERSSDLVLESIKVHELVHQVVKSFSQVFISKKLKLLLLMDEVELVSDKKWLKFALSQILSNALKYTNDGQITIILNKYSLSIQDTGIGIQPQDLPRIFEKGFSGERSLEKENASGIGLYLCKKSLDLIGHEIEVQSQLEEGSTFIIHLHQTQMMYE